MCASMLDTKPEHVSICIDIKQRKEKKCKNVTDENGIIKLYNKQRTLFKETFSCLIKILKKTYCF